MKAKNWLMKHWPAPLWVGIIVFAPVVRAQPVIAPPTGQATMSSFGQFNPGGPKAPALSQIASAFASSGPLVEWGPFAVRPFLTYRVLYGDGILSVPGEPVNTTVQTTTLGLLVEVGSHWTANYAITRTGYSDRLLTDTYDHNAGLVGGYSFDDWTLGFSQSYGSNSPTLIETGQQTYEKTYSTGANASYQLGDSTLLDFSVNRGARYANALRPSVDWKTSDWVSWTTSDWVRYKVSPTLVASVGVLLGYDQVSGSPDMSYTQPQAQLSWQVSKKISIGAQVGMQSRKIDGGDSARLNNPVYSGSIRYQVADATAVSFSGSRAVQASFFENEVTKTTSWAANVEQRLFRRYYLNAGVSHGQTTYITTRTNIAAGRDDSFDSLHLSVSTTFLRRGSISLFYQTSRNSSSRAVFGQSSHQVGADIGYRY